MSDLANLLRVTAKEMAEHDEPPSWHQPIVEAADEIEKLRKAIRDALKLADLDAIKSFRKTLLLALGEKE